MATQITEKYSFKTDIMTSYSGKEQRVMTRREPRRSYSYDYDAMDSIQAQWIRGIGRLRISDTFYVPMWQNVIYLRHDFNGGRNLEVDPDYLYGLRDCQYLEVFTQDDVPGFGYNDVLKINNVYDGVIELRNPFRKSLDKRNTWIFPLRKCAVQPSDSVKYVYHHGASTTLNFLDLLESSNKNFPQHIISEYRGMEEINPFKLPVTFNDKEVFMWEPTWTSEDETLSTQRNYVNLDNDTGQFVYDLKNTRYYDINSYKFLLHNRNMIDNMIKFFIRMGGKYKSFYMPSWVQDFVPSRDIRMGDSSMLTEFDNYYRFFGNSTRDKYLIFFFKNMTHKIMRISGHTYEMINKRRYGKILLGGSFDRDIKLDDIRLISFFNLVRLDNDDLQIDYESNVVATTQLVFKEVDDNF